MGQKMIVTNSEVFDGSGSEPVADLAVVVEGDRIADVIGVNEVPSEGDQIILDLPGTTLLPGLIDMHVHLCNWSAPAAVASDPVPLTAHAAANARVTQRAGITTVRDVGSPWGIGVAIRDSVARGETLGSKVIATGHLICMTGGHGTELGHPRTFSREADGPDDCRKAVREEISAGADWIKVALDGARTVPGKSIVEFTQSEVAVIVDEAHRLGVRVACHVFLPASAAMALKAGVDTIEHGLHLTEENVAGMAEQGIVLVPTIRLPLHIIEIKEQLEAVNEYGAVAVRHATAALPTHAASFKRALAAGVTIAAGTDTSSFVGGIDSLVSDLDYMVELGMTPTEALLSATSTAAKTLDMAGDIGTIAPGAVADLLICKGAPTNDIRALDDVMLVMQDGETVVAAPEITAAAAGVAPLAGLGSGRLPLSA